MFLSVLNITEVVTYNISAVGMFMGHPVFLVLALSGILFTLALTRYEARQKAGRLAREEHKRRNQAARAVLQQHQLLHHMMQNETDKI